MSGWEKVGKSKTNKTKAQKIKEVEKMPKQDIEVAPLDVSKSMFGALEDKAKKGQKQPLQDRSNMQGSPKGGNKKSKNSKKKANLSFRYDTFEEAVGEVSVSGILQTAKEQGGNQVWQKQIISLINDKISCPEEDPAFSNKKDPDFPLSKVSKPMLDMMKKLFVDDVVSDQIRQILFDHCMLTLMEHLDRDMPTWGYRLCIQVLARYAPQNCMDELERHSTKLQNMQSSPKKCLSYLWALAQIGAGDVRLGMEIWLTVMLPFLSVKKFAAFVVQTLENLLKVSRNPQKDLSRVIDNEHFMQIMKWTYDTSTGLDPSLRERLRAVFGTLKIIATGTMHLKLALFEKFLRTPVDEIKKVESPFVEIAWECARDNPECFKSWRDYYTSSLPQTRILLEYVDARWDSSKVPNAFQKTVLYFHNENMEAAAQSSSMTSVPGFKAVRGLCQDFLRRLEKRSNQSRSRCNSVLSFSLVLLIAVGVGLFFYDVNIHGGKVEKSATYKFLKSKGVLEYMVIVSDKVTDTTRFVMKWLQKNVPYYWTLTRNLLGPYVTYIGNALYDLWVSAFEASAPVRAYLVTASEKFLIWADEVVRKAIPFAQDVYQQILPYASKLSQWLDAKLMAFISVLNGEVGWCCIRDAAVESAMYVYNTSVEMCVFAWDGVVRLGKFVGDYVSGENMN